MGRIEQIVVINDFAVPEGGAGVLALQSVRQYRRLGYPVTFVTGQGATAELQALGVTVVGLNSHGLLQLPAAQALRQGFDNGAAERMVADWIGRHDTPGTVYHLHNWSQILSPNIFRALRRVDERTIVTCHDFFNICPNGGFLHFRKSQPCELRPLSMRCVMSQCDRRNALHKYWRVGRHIRLNQLSRFGASRSTFAFLHDRMRDKYLQSGFAANDLITIPNPVEPWSRQRIPAERNSGFLFVGRIGRDKGADIALAAARQADQRITMIGSGELAVAADHPHAHFAGWCDRDAIVQHARHARALIVPSRVIEPFGLVIFEAAMSGLPVIVSDRAYFAANVEAGGFGRSFSVTNGEALADLLAVMADDDALIEQMSRTGFTRAESFCHTPQSWISAYVDLFESKLDRARSPATN